MTIKSEIRKYRSEANVRMRDERGRFFYDHEAIGFVIQQSTSDVSLLIIPYELWAEVVAPACDVQVMSDKSGGGEHLRINRLLGLRRWGLANQDKCTWIRLCDKSEWDEGLAAWQEGQNKARYNAGWYAEKLVREYLGLEAHDFNRNAHSMGDSDINMTDTTIGRVEIKCMVGKTRAQIKACRGRTQYTD